MANKISPICFLIGDLSGSEPLVGRAAEDAIEFIRVSLHDITKTSSRTREEQQAWIKLHTVVMVGDRAQDPVRSAPDQW